MMAAIQSLHCALELRPDFADAHRSLGIVYEKAGEATAATEHYRRTVALAADHAWAITI